MANKRNRKTIGEAVSNLSSPARQPGRGTFDVARARRQLVDDLGPVVYSKPPLRPKLAMTQIRQDGPSLAQARAKAARPVRDEAPPARSGLDMSRLETGCKARPASSKGSGSGRAFVPWCKK